MLVVKQLFSFLKRAIPFFNCKVFVLQNQVSLTLPVAVAQLAEDSGSKPTANCTWAKYYKTFLFRNLSMWVISWSVGP
jgi:hypothetical protein